MNGKNSLTADNVTLNLTVEQGQLKFQGQWDTDVFLDGTVSPSLAADFSGKIRGEFSGELNNGFVTLNVPSFQTDLFKLRPLTVNCTLADGKIEIRKINDQIPLDLYVGYDLGSEKLSGEFQSEDFLLGELLSFTGPWAKYNAWLALRTTGAASFGYDRDGKISYDLDLSGIIPAAMSWGMGDTAYNIAGRGDQGYITVDNASLHASLGDLEFSGEIGLEPFAPNGTLSLSNLSLSGDSMVNGDFSITTEGRELTLSGENLSLGSVSIPALDGVIQWEDTGISFFVSALQFRNIESWDVQPVEQVVDGFYSFNPRELQATVFLSSFPLVDMINIARPFGNIPAVPDWALGRIDDIAVTTEIFINTDFEHVLYNAPHFVVASVGGSDDFSVFSLSGTDMHLDVEEGRIVLANKVTVFSGSTDFSSLQYISFNLQFSHEEVSYYFDGLVLDQRSLDIQGAYGLSVHVERTELGGYSGYIETAGFPVPINGQFARVTLDTSMRYEAGNQWSFEIRNLEVRELAIPASLTTTIVVRGRGNQDGAWFSELLFDDGRGSLSGRASASWNEDFSDIIGNVSLANPENAEEFTLDGGWSGGSLALQLQVTQVQLGRIIRNSNNIMVTGAADITWNSSDSFLAKLDLSSLTASMGETPVHASVLGTLTADDFRAENLRISYGGLNAEFPYFMMNNKTPVVETEAHIWGTALSRDMDLSLVARVDFNPLDSWFEINRMLQSFSGDLLVNHIRFDTIESPEPFNFVFSRSESLIALSGGPGEDMIQMWFAGDGGFYVGLSNPLPIRGAVSGTITGGTINAHSSDLTIDMGSLWLFVPHKRFQIPEGIITASLNIQGPLADPEFYGIAFGTELRLRIPQFLTEDIGPTPVTLLLDGNMMTFGPLNVKVGSGQGRVSGWFRFDRWIPDTFAIDIQAVEEQAIPFGLDVGRVRAQGLTSGVLKVSMDRRILTITGDLTGHDTEITLDTQRFADETEAASFAPSSIPVITDINIRTGSKVEFLWPNADFPIIRAQADRGANLAVKIDTQTDRYTVVGDVRLRSGEIFYIQRSFYLREGTLYFNEDELKFEPQISARAEIREYADEGPVTISLIIDRSPLESFQTKFESTPPLSQIDIISILGQNLTGPAGAGGSDVLANMLAASSDFLAQFQVVRRLERYVRDFTRLDMFSFRSQVLQNAVLGATRRQAPDDRMSLVSNYFDNTAVFLGKYIGSDMFFQSMFSLRYDENKKTMGGYAFEPDFGIELRSPLFDIRWDFVPRHPEYMFVNDHSITLTWRWTF
ncbi:MAG: translocation/assembly module TamB [Spirochaetaceae bacterium]|jgi:hypothetical protein|nr:translocation/assembly module TamB [Spirochaetaceae bacterium]